MWSRRLRGGFAALLVGLLVVASSPASVSAQAPPPHYAITGVRIVTGTGTAIESGTIVIQDGLISAVGADVAVPPGAWTLDSSGLTAYPGLIDALTTLALPSELQASQGGGFPGFGGGGGQQVDPDEYARSAEDRPATFTWVNAADNLESGDSRIEAWRNAGFTTVVTSPSKGLLPGNAAVINLAGARPNDMVVATPVAVMTSFTKGRDFAGFPSSLMGIIAYIKQTFFDARHYDDAWAIYAASPGGVARPRYDRALEPLREALADGQPVLFAADLAREIKRTADIARDIGVSPIIYGGRQGYEVAEFLAANNIPVLVNLDWPKRNANGDPEAEEPLQTLRYLDRAPTTPAALHAAGARFAFTSGSLSSAGDVLRSARLAVRAGLPADAALHAFTMAPAELFGVSDRLGSIEAGKIANVVLADGDLFSAGTKVKQTIVDGHLFEVEEDTDGEAEEETGPYEAIPMAKTRGPVRSNTATLIRNATVITVSGATIENGDVLIRDGKIAEVSTGLSAPSGAHVVDATGKYVIPGIIDAHSHIAAEAINEGSVSVSAMGGIRDVINPDQVSIYRTLAGGVTTANVLHGSANPIGGRNAVIKLRWGADAHGLLMQQAPLGIKFALGENVKRDRNPDRYPNSRMGVMDVIRQTFLDAQEYQAEGRRYEQAISDGEEGVIPPRRNLTLDPIVEILEGTRLVHAHSYRADEILQLLRVAEEFDVRIGTLQHVLEGYRVADEIAEHGAGASTFSDWWAYKVEAYEAIPYNAAIMTDRGVTVSINSDSGEEIRHLNQEAAKTMKWGGMSENEALRMVTLNPAIQLGIDQWVGSIEVGKDADLAIYEGHPLSVYGVVEMTFVDGLPYFDRAADAQMRAAIANEREQLVAKQQPAEGGRRGRPTEPDEEVNR